MPNKYFFYILSSKKAAQQKKSSYLGLAPGAADFLYIYGQLKKKMVWSSFRYASFQNNNKIFDM